MIAVRPAVVADAEAISALLIASITELCHADHQGRPEALEPWLANKSVEGVRRWFDNPRTRLFVALRDGNVAAAGGVNSDREVILNYVAPPHRLAGVSSTLLAAMERALGPGRATLASTETAHAFYLARGWHDTGRTDRAAGMTAYLMHKQL